MKDVLYIEEHVTFRKDKKKGTLLFTKEAFVHGKHVSLKRHDSKSNQINLHSYQQKNIEGLFGSCGKGWKILKFSPVPFFGS